MNENPYASPNSPLLIPEGDIERVKDVARAQRMLLISILASFAGNVLLRSEGLTPFLLLPVALGIAGFSVWCIYRLCKALELGPILWVLAMFVPVINLISLLVLNQKATGFLKSHGVKVGLMGARV